jgi:hypothetical protein
MIPTTWSDGRTAHVKTARGHDIPVEIVSTRDYDGAPVSAMIRPALTVEIEEFTGDGRGTKRRRLIRRGTVSQVGAGWLRRLTPEDTFAAAAKVAEYAAKRGRS